MQCSRLRLIEYRVSEWITIIRFTRYGSFFRISIKQKKGASKLVRFVSLSFASLGYHLPTAIKSTHLTDLHWTQADAFLLLAARLVAEKRFSISNILRCTVFALLLTHFAFVGLSKCVLVASSRVEAQPAPFALFYAKRLKTVWPKTFKP